MPNLFNPTKFNMFGFLKEVKGKAADFTMTRRGFNVNNVRIPFFYTDLTQPTIYLKLGTPSNEIYGAMRLQAVTIGVQVYHMVDRVCAQEKYRGSGIVKFLYKQALDEGLKLLSDSTHTTFGSKDIWLKFRRYFPSKKLFIVNVATHHKREFIDQEEHKIWGKEKDDDFDILDEVTKLYLIEGLYDGGELSIQQRDFFVAHIKHIEDRRDIRLSVED